ncbi:MAG: aminopeptidase P family protein [Candidatus Latescibacteria bacterium]|nr:aminopeptidase P family protein [Candidatus Latescibacterota bacterium]
MNTSGIFPPEEFLRRAQQVEFAMERAGIDALIAYSVKNQPGPVAYLSGYEPCLGLHDVAFFGVVPGRRPSRTLLTNAFWDRPQERAWADEVLITGDFGAKLIGLLPGSVRRIGIAGYRFFPAPVYAALRSAFPEARIEDATGLLMEIARVKSPEEIEVIRRCATITDAGGRAFLEGVREGAGEREIQAGVERSMMLAGADGLVYFPQVYSGPQVAFGIGFSEDRILVRGEQAQVDCGAHYGGYRGDLSRVTTVGPPSSEVRAIMETTAGMYEAMLHTVRAGVPIADVARENVMEPYLYGSPSHTPGFVGHGIGCWYHELPEIHPGEKGVLQAGMVIVLEPILVRPGFGGAKIEDAVLVTDQGAERLSGLEIRTW